MSEPYFALDLGDESYDSTLEIGGYSGELVLQSRRRRDCRRGVHSLSRVLCARRHGYVLGMCRGMCGSATRTLPRVPSIHPLGMPPIDTGAAVADVEWGHAQTASFPSSWGFPAFDLQVCGRSMMSNITSFWPAVVSTGSACLGLPEEVIRWYYCEGGGDWGLGIVSPLLTFRCSCFRALLVLLEVAAGCAACGFFSFFRPNSIVAMTPNTRRGGRTRLAAVSRKNRRCVLSVVIVQWPGQRQRLSI